MPVPDHIGRHQIRECLGSGGFATVWRAYDAELDADVAVKILAENWVNRDDVRARFTDEARLLRRADSDRVVRVHDIGTLDDDRPYFVMTYADGGTLGDRLSAGPLPVAEALRLTAEAARGVAVLHELGVVHRDIKPSNVLFRSSGSNERVMIADLGIAKAVAGSSGFTLAAGTPGYMAPEQTTANRLDTRADVYALGALCYEMLTGQRPAAGPTGGVRPPSTVRPGLPPGTDTVVMRALAQDRAQRFPDAAAFADAVEPLRTGAAAGGGQPRPGGAAAVARTPRPQPPPMAGHQPHQPHPPQPAPVPHLAPPPHAPAPGARTPGGTPAPGSGAPGASGGGSPKKKRRRRRRRFIALGVVCGLILLSGGGCAGLNLWFKDEVTVSAAGGRISIEVPRFWTFLKYKTEGEVELTRYGAKGTGYQLRNGLRNLDVSESSGSFVVVASRSFPANDAPHDSWLPARCHGQGVDREFTNPRFESATIRIWAKGKCADDDKFALAILRGRDYGVRAYMTTDQVDEAQLFVDAAKTIEVDPSTVPE